ncbi:hypothetical protein V6N13_025291 [Hibiscus sabdariffa]
MTEQQGCCNCIEENNSKSTSVDDEADRRRNVDTNFVPKLMGPEGKKVPNENVHTCDYNALYDVANKQMVWKASHLWEESIELNVPRVVVSVGSRVGCTMKKSIFC